MPVAYALFIVFVVWALRRAPAWRVALMISAPPALAVILTTLLVRGLVSGPFVLAASLPCVVLVIAGFFLKPNLPAASQLLGLLGWTIVAGILLIPATTVLLAPVAGLAAFLIPDTSRRVQAHGA